MNKLLLMISTSLVLGCSTISNNGPKIAVKDVSYPELGKVVTAYVGDRMVGKGKAIEESVLAVRKYIDGDLYDIPDQVYTQIGYDDTQDFYSADGVVRAGFSEPIRALSLEADENSALCVVTVYGRTFCYDGDYERENRLIEREDSFQQTLIYSGRVGDTISISYREFNNQQARSAYTNDAQYDLSQSKVIGYKGAVIEVLEADNSSITYKLIKNFP